MSHYALAAVALAATLLAAIDAAVAAPTRDVPLPACRHRELTTPGYTLPPSRFDPPNMLSDRERETLNGTWTSCDGATFVLGGRCAGRVREQWTFAGGMCERTADGRTDLAFCHATRVAPGLVELALSLEHSSTVVRLIGTSRHMRRQ